MKDFDELLNNHDAQIYNDKIEQAEIRNQERRRIEESRKRREEQERVDRMSAELGEWWFPNPSYTWSELMNFNVSEFQEKNPRSLAFDSLLSLEHAKYYKNDTQRLPATTYSVFARCSHLAELCRLNNDLAMAEIERMAEIDSKVKMMSTTKWNFNAGRMIDYLEHGFLYAHINKLDKSVFQNEKYWVRGKERTFQQGVKIRLIGKIREEMKKRKGTLNISKIEGHNAKQLF